MSRDEVLDRLNAGDPSGAALIAHQILAADPSHADVLGLLGLALEDAGDKVGAVDALRRAVALPAGLSIALRNTANLAAMLIAGGLKDEASTLLRAGWQWPPDAVIGDNERQCVVLLADIMKGLELKEELVAFLLPILERMPQHWDVVRRTAIALSGVGRHEDALAPVEASSLSPSEMPDHQAVLAHLYGLVGRPEKADAAIAAFAYHAPPYATPSEPGQWFTVGVLNPLPAAGIRDPEAPADASTVPASHPWIAQDRDRHFNANYPAQLAKGLTDRYRFASILLGAGPSSVARFRQLDARVLINNVTNAEVLRDGRSLAKAQALVDAIGLPTINRPERAALCTRQMNFERFAGMPNVVVPRLKRINLDLGRLDEIVGLAEQSFTYPLVVRTVRDHFAHNIVLVQDREALKETLQSYRRHPQVYLIQYVGAKRHNGCYRKIRAVVVDRELSVVWADYGLEWAVLSRALKHTQDLYRDRPDVLADANDIVARPDERLGAAAMAALHAIGRAVPLDIFGMDFDVDDSGRIVLFEANATMALFSGPRTSIIAWPDNLRYPYAPTALSLERTQRLLHRKAETGISA